MIYVGVLLVAAAFFISWKWGAMPWKRANNADVIANISIYLGGGLIVYDLVQLAIERLA